MRIRVAILVLLLSASGAGISLAQGTKADYDRADALPELRHDKVFKLWIVPHWDTSGDRFWYCNDLVSNQREYIQVNATDGKISAAFDHVALADALSSQAKASVNSTKLSLTAIEPFEPGEVKFEFEDKSYRWDLKSKSLSLIDKRAAAEASAKSRKPRKLASSPDQTYSVFERDHNLILVDRTSGIERPLTKDGTEADGYSVHQLAWSPDSSKLVATRTKQGGSRKVNLIESSPIDQLQPKLSNYPYLKPGDEVPRPVPHLFKLDSAEEIATGGSLSENLWSIDNLRWSADSSRFTYLYNQRGHQVLRVISVDAKTGIATVIVEEKSPTFIDYSQKTECRFLDKTDELIWMSERSGWNHLYLIESKTGMVKNPITQGEWVVRSIEHIDETKRIVWMRVMGIQPDQDPYYVHYACVNFDGTDFKILTVGDGTHTVSYSPDRRFLIDTYSRVDMHPKHQLRRATDGTLICEFEKADISALLQTDWKPPERFHAKGRDGQTEIHGVVYRPANYNPSKRYPVIEQVYAGPQNFYVPKSFSSYHRVEALAELGFVVVQVDGMGTNWRSKSFHDVCWKNLRDAGFPDRIAWLKALAAQDPAIDIARVGIYGGSAGGQNALGALLFHHDFYSVAVADCGCHDNRMDKIWWNEAWMGWPVGAEYAANSNVTHAKELRGKLMLTVGELDRNVDPASTMQVVNALIKADKDFDLIIFPGGGHGAGSSPYGSRRLRDFFVRHLHGVEPRGF